MASSHASLIGQKYTVAERDTRQKQEEKNAGGAGDLGYQLYSWLLTQGANFCFFREAK